MTKPVRIGAHLHPQHAADYGKIRDAVRRAEDLGVDEIYNWDHFYPLYGPNGERERDPAAPAAWENGPHFEGWTTLAAWAEQTERVKLGVLVTCGSYRNPDLLADMARTVDHISGGRLIFGLGAGWFEKDYQEYGYEFGTAGSRLDRFASDLDRVQARLTKLNPKPVGELPILIGGGGERKTLRLVAQHAQIWHSFNPIEEFQRKDAILVEHCAAVGRDPGEIDRSQGWPGSAEATDYADAGVISFTVGTSGPDYDFTTLREALAWRERWNEAHGLG